MNNSTVNYKITVKTSDAYRDAGTNSYVYIKLIGSHTVNRTTDWHLLDILLRDDFQRGATDIFNVKMKDVGIPEIIEIRIDDWLYVRDEWLCETISVTRNDKTVLFPVYSYIDHKYEIMDGKAKLPQYETSRSRIETRIREIQRNKEEFQWIDTEQASSGVCRYVKASGYENLPRIFKRTLSRERGLDGHRQGWQLLNGTLPLAFEACHEIPFYFNVTNNDVKHLLRTGKSLEEEMKSGRVFISDLSKIYFENNELVYTLLPSKNEARCCPAMALLYVNQSDDFVPIAIQLERNNRQYLHIAAQDDYQSQVDWMLAKMYYRCSLTSYHEWIYHFLHCHFMMEPIALALFRCFSKVHPVYKLLRPHLKTVCAINEVGRKVLLPKDSRIAKGLAVDPSSFVKNGYKDFVWKDLCIPEIIKKKGLIVENIPNYWYARDALTIWNKMESFVKELLSCYYLNDQDIKNDTELQDWINEIVTEGIAWEDENTRGFPTSFLTIESLVDFSTTVMFTCSVQHTAVNFGQFENYHFVPNSPALMNLPSHKKGEGSMERILHSLPNPSQAVLAVAMAYGLSQLTEADEFLGTYNTNWFTEEKALKCYDRFKNDLKKVQENIEKRNLKLKRSYNRLNPIEIPINVAI